MQQDSKIDAIKPRCGLCGKTDNLTQTPCCKNWICDDADQYVAFSYARNSCFRNHTLFTICGFHGNEKHAGRWQDCEKCRNNPPLELYVHHATNEYNFEKLENPPAFEPTHCSRCGKVIRLAQDGYSMTGDDYSCDECAVGPSKNFMEAMQPEKTRGEGSFADVPVKVTGKRGAYPMATIVYYGPDNRLATKVAVSIVKSPDAENDPLHRWISHAGDVRHDAAIQSEIASFLEKEGVRQTITPLRITGCAHQEGVDYPSGGKCPHCPFWHDRNRFTHRLFEDESDFESTAPTRRTTPKIGRNDLCPCGSGKKYKKCCGS